MTDHLLELDQRTINGISVALLWRRSDDRLFVAVVDEKSGESFRLEVRDGEPPREVFQHPYAYAAWHGIEPRAEICTVPAAWT